MAANGNFASDLVNDLNRADFGDDFIFGGASSAYQNEGAAAEEGRGPSIWDTFTHRNPGRIVDGGNGNVAIDQYHLYKDDVQMIKKIGLDAYRFSISWSRVLPGGRISAGVNKEGIQYYNNLIDELLANGIQPFVTLFHWDVPQALEDEYGGFLSREIVKDFCEFAELCFWEFGDRVKSWTTLNEAWSFAVGGYVMGSFAPGRGPSSHEHVQDIAHIHRCHYGHSHICEDGDPGREPYLVAHHLLLAHAEVVQLYRQNFKAQEGRIGITNVSQWWEPLHDTPQDNEAVQRAADFMLGWFTEPITSGDYPQSMKDRVQSRLPKFSPEESKKLAGSYDFLGLNYYTSQYVTGGPSSSSNELKSYVTDQEIKTQTVGPDGKTEIGERGGSSWLYIYPPGIYKLLRHVKTKYGDPLIYITENGVDEVNNPGVTVSEARMDPQRIKYHQDHLSQIKQAMDVDKVRVKGYFIWSLFDNFEWAEGYTVRFGIIHINYKDGYARYPKQSALWFMNFLKKRNAVIGTQDPKVVSTKRGLELPSSEQETPRRKVGRR